MARKTPDKQRPQATGAARKARAVALVAAGARVADAAQAVGLTRQTVSEWTNAGEGREQLQRIIDHAIDATGQKLAAVATEAVDVLVDVMRTGANDGDRLNAAKYLCDRVLGKPQGRVEVDGKVTTTSADALERLPTKELARRLLAVIDVESEEEDKT